MFKVIEGTDPLISTTERPPKTERLLMSLDAITPLSLNVGNVGSDAAGGATARFHQHKRGDVLHRPR